ncbi:MAG TPA: DUF4230 domain-containing protein [Terracidiphilus sp.]|jgi:hypothetical protein|nr:DUF4230 domain-containing protein [Terracidiphilus sp.]
MEYIPAVTPPPRKPIISGWGLVAGSLMAGAALGLVLVIAAVAGISNLARLLTGRSTVMDTSAPAVVDKIRQLSRLEAVDYTIDKIVEGDRQSQLMPNFLAGDRLLLVAHGEVIAGVDLDQMDGKRVRVEGDSVHVTLPPPQVLVARLDNAQTRVYSRETGLLVAADPNLESEARATAEQEITKAALADGILDKARQNTRAAVTGLLYALGFRRVDVQ